MSKKRITSLIISYSAALVLVLSGFVYKYYNLTKTYKLYIENDYQHAFSELVAAVDEVDKALRKSLYVSSPSMVSSVCTEVFGKTQAAQMALSELPFASERLENTASFIAKVGDYVYTVSRSAAAGNAHADGELDNLRSLSESASVLSQNLQEYFTDINEGRLLISELDRVQGDLAKNDDRSSSKYLSDTFKTMESEFPEVPSLIYDGPFSQHISQLKPKWIENEEFIDESEALNIAADFVGLPANELSEPILRDGNLPVYSFTSQNGDSTITIEVTKQGEKVLYMSNTRSSSAQNIKVDDAVDIASDFLEEKGYDSMEPTYWTLFGNSVLINFAYTEDDIIFYPDLIKVSVALDNGQINGFESLGFLMSHTKRDIPGVEITWEDAAENIAPDLKVLSHQMAVIPTAGKNEVYCHEFKCETEDEQHVILYVNASTGIEEKLLILLESENGTLTI